MPPPPAAAILDHFGPLDDPRSGPTVRHRLLDIVTIALCAVVCGADTWAEVKQFGRDKLDWLRTILPLPNGVPSHDAFGRVFAALDPEQFEGAFASWVRAVARLTAGEVVAVDGKVLRRSHDRAGGKGELALVDAWAGANRLALGQVAAPGGCNEIEAIPELLRLLARKGNQGTLHAAVEVLFAEGRASGWAGLAHSAWDTGEKDHGRIERRRVWAVDDPEVIAYLDPAGAWPGLRSVALVEAERRIGAAASREVRCSIGSLPGDAERIGAAVRGHWGTENGLHWVLDVAFREDECRVRQGAAGRNLAVLRRLALALLRREARAKMGVKAKRRKAGWSPAYLRTVLDT